MTRAEIRELLLELKKYAITLSVSNFRVFLSGGNFKAKEHYENMIDADEDIQAMLILEYSKTDPNIRYDIEERASIRWAEGGEYNLLAATKSLMKWSREFDEWRLMHGAGEE